MNFFEHQAQARRDSTRLVILFALAVLGIVVAVNLVVALVGQVGLGGFHQIGDQVEPALQLHVDLGEGIPVRNPRPHQPVVKRHHPRHDQRYEYQQNHEAEHDCSPIP